MLKKDISTWNMEVYGLVDRKRSKALDELSRLEQATESRLQSQDEKLRAFNLKLELEQLAIAEETSWRQKSRCLWLSAGDRNTKFFQRMASPHRRKNHIERLQIGEGITEDKDRIKAEILNYYQKLYTESEPWRPTVDFEGLATLSLEERNSLEILF